MLIPYFTCLILFLIPICTIVTQQLYTIIAQYLILSKFKKIKQNNPDNDNNINDIASIYIQRKQWISSIMLLENEFIKNKQFNIKYLNLIGLCYLKMELYEFSEYFYTQVLQEEPRNIISLLGIANIHQNNNKSESAIKLYSQILSIDKTNRIALKAIQRISKTK